MASVNKVILLGNLGADPDVRYTADGNRAIATLSLATTRRYRNAEGQPVSETEWHRVVLFGRTAEIAKDYLHKGSPAYIEGRLRTRKWTDQQGQDRYTTEIVGDVLQLLGGRSQSYGDAPMSGGDFDTGPRPTPAARPQAPAARAQPAPAAQPASSATSSPIDDIGEDVPF